METKYYFDIGSSTIKLYKYENKNLELIKEKSINFKQFFSNSDGISNNNYNKLLKCINSLGKENNLNKENTKIIATGIWRKIPDKQLTNLKSDFRNLNLEFNVITHEQESFYFSKAMQGIYSGKKVMMVNMGGKTTEIVIIDKGNIKNKINLDIGVGDILARFPKINFLKTNLEEIISFILEKIKDIDLDFSCDCAIHTGGELRFQKLLKYNLQLNNIFYDGIHNLMVSYDDFCVRNEQIIDEISLEELYELMPGNPAWMDGAKAGILLGQAIFKKANIKYIVPSDLNIINGIIKEENK